ncbi:hypothetical protein N9A39_03115 [Planktomarina temperata]|nr:hypothetical protein [Planktomarina temperata]
MDAATSYDLIIAGENKTTGSGDDTFSGTIGQDNGGTNEQTLNAEDELDAGAGTDTLSVTLNADAGAPILLGFEVVTVRSVDDSQVLSFANADTALTTLNLRDSSTDLNIDDLQVVPTINITNVSDNVDIDFAADVLGTETATFAANVDEFDGVLTVSVNGDDAITSVSLSATGEDSAVDSEAWMETVTTLTVSGSADLTLADTDTDTSDDDFAALTTISAGSMTGGLTLDLGTNDEDFTLTAGAGDDVITVSSDGDEGRSIDLGAGDDTYTVEAAADINIGGGADAGDSVDGGAGDDTLAITGSNGADVFAKDVSDVFSNFEEVLITTDNDDTLDLDNLTSIQSVTIRNGVDDDTMDITNVVAQTLTVQTGNAAGSDVIGEVTFALEDATGSDDTYTVSVVGRYDGTSNAITNFQFDGVENLTVNVDYASAIDTAANQVFLITSLDAAEAETVNFSGNADLTVTFDDAVADQVINAAAMSGELDLTYAETADVTITASAQDDTITMVTGMNADDTVDGGAGDDLVEAAVASTSGNATLALAAISNVETVAVAVTSDGAVGETATINAAALVSGTLEIDATQGGTFSNSDTIAITGLKAGVSVTIDQNITAGTSDYLTTIALGTATGSADALTIFLKEADNGNQAVDDLTIADIETLTFSVSADTDNDTVDDVEITDLSADDAETIIIVSEEDFDLSLTDSDSLETIDATAAVRGLDIDLNGSTDDTGVEILLADATAVTTTIAITLDATDTGADIINFGAAKVGAVTINNFDAGAGLLKDKIDLSDYGITGLSDLAISDDGTDTTIDVTDDLNFGSITIAGVLEAALVADNFIFA